MRTRLALAAVAAAALVATTACTGSDGDAASAAGGGAPASGAVSGPLCDLLPSGDDPGNPTALASEPVDVALQWIPVLTTFEAAMRASDLLPELKGKSGITVLAPTDDAFGAKFSQDNLDELMIEDKDTLRTLLRAHVVDRPLDLATLREVGTVTTLDGATVPVAAADAMARIGEEAQTVCADYRIANGRVHVINRVLGTLPTTAGQGSDPGH